MLTEEEIEQIKHFHAPAVTKLLAWYEDSLTDGVVAIKITLNNYLLKLNEEMSEKQTDYNVILETMENICKVLKLLPKEILIEKNKQSSVSSKGKRKSIFDGEADRNR